MFSEFKAKEENEFFAEYRPLVQLGRLSQSLTQNQNKLEGKRVIDPFKKCGGKPNSKFNWSTFFDNAKYTELPVNQVYY